MAMTYGTVPGVEKRVSRLVQGTVIINTKEEERSFALLDGVFAQGCTTFDTAHHYGQGESERALGAWIASRGVRDQVVILTKGAHHNKDRRRVTPFDITSDLHDSLARLKTDFVDLYLLHRDDPAVPVSEIVEVLNAHHRAGKIGALGGSNWSVARIQEANAYARANGLQPFVASSPNFSLAVQTRSPWENCISISGPTAKAERDWYAVTKMPLFTWSSLAGGFFSGRFTRDNLGQFTTYDDVMCVDVYCTEDNFRRLDRVQTLAGERGATVPQIATAYVLSQPLNIFAIVGCQTTAEFASNVEAVDLELTPEELAWLDLRSESR
ncbi:MAG TPA: aldo/keto reductase [Thermomicrobiales bacterium]|nr:aldo/keto reductase [Thermomicrobiales bacterium]